MRLSQQRIVILSLLLAVAASVFLLGVRLHIEPRLYWRDLWFLLSFIAFGGTLFWLIAYAPRSARLYSLGFVLGTALENVALGYYTRHDLLRSTPGTWLPEGWYPLTVPVARILIERGWGSIAAPPLSAVFVGMALSGILCSVLVLVAHEQWLRVA